MHQRKTFRLQNHLPFDNKYNFKMKLQYIFYNWINTDHICNAASEFSTSGGPCERRPDSCSSKPLRSAGGGPRRAGPPRCKSDKFVGSSCLGQVKLGQVRFGLVKGSCWLPENLIIDTSNQNLFNEALNKCVPNMDLQSALLSF